MSSAIQIEDSLPAFVYRAFADDGRLLYVGVTRNPKMRVAQHRGQKAWWAEQVARVDVQMYPTLKAATAIERRALVEEAPVYNLAGTPGYAPKSAGPGRPVREPLRQTGEARRPGIKHYTARVTRDGRFWLIHVHELDRVTQARHLREVEFMTRDLIAVMEEVEPDSFTVDIDIVVPESPAAHLRRADELRVAEAEARAAAAAEVRAAAVELKRDGVPLRDIGKLLNVSFQRAGQLTQSP